MSLKFSVSKKFVKITIGAVRAPISCKTLHIQSKKKKKQEPLTRKMGIRKGVVKKGDYQNPCRPEVNFLVILNYIKDSQNMKVRDGSFKV